MPRVGTNPINPQPLDVGNFDAIRATPIPSPATGLVPQGTQRRLLRGPGGGLFGHGSLGQDRMAHLPAGMNFYDFWRAVRTDDQAAPPKAGAGLPTLPQPRGGGGSSSLASAGGGQPTGPAPTFDFNLKGAPLEMAGQFLAGGPARFQPQPLGQPNIAALLAALQQIFGR